MAPKPHFSLPHHPSQYSPFSQPSNQNTHFPPLSYEQTPQTHHPYENPSYYRAHLGPSTFDASSLRIPKRALAPRSVENRMQHFILKNEAAPAIAEPFVCPSRSRRGSLRIRRGGGVKGALAFGGVSERGVCKSRGRMNVNEVGRVKDEGEVVNESEKENEKRKGEKSGVNGNVNRKKNDKREKADKNRNRKVDFAVPIATFRRPSREEIVRTASGPNLHLSLGSRPPKRPRASYSLAPWEYARRVSDSSLSSNSSIFSNSAGRKDSNSSTWSAYTEVGSDKGVFDPFLGTEMPVLKKGKGHIYVDLETVEEGRNIVPTKPMPLSMTMGEFVEELLVEYPNFGG